VKKPTTPKPAAKKAAAQTVATSAPCRTAAATLQSYELSTAGHTKALATELATFIRENGLSMQLQGRADKNYVNVEGWQYAGSLLSIVPIVEHLSNYSNEAETKYEAKVTLLDLKTGQTVGAGFAICSNKESGKKFYQEFAIASMAQTRAIGKAYRNVLAWIIRAAGYEATPAEEMDYAGTPAQVQGGAARVTPAAASEQPVAIHPALASEAAQESAAVPTSTNEQTAQAAPQMTVSRQPAARPALQSDGAQAVAAKYAADVAAGVVFITPTQHQLIVMLLNNTAIKAGDKQRMLLGLNRITAAYASSSIVKILQRIKDNKGTPHPDTEQLLLKIGTEVKAATVRSEAMLELRDFVQKNAEHLGAPETDRLLTICENPAATTGMLQEEKAAAAVYLAEMPAA
jgi:hypothetical protein